MPKNVEMLRKVGEELQNQFNVIPKISPNSVKVHVACLSLGDTRFINTVFDENRELVKLGIKRSGKGVTVLMTTQE